MRDADVVWHSLRTRSLTANTETLLMRGPHHDGSRTGTSQHAQALGVSNRVQAGSGMNAIELRSTRREWSRPSSGAGHGVGVELRSGAQACARSRMKSSELRPGVRNRF
eukprot:199646-Rhodomonas_salina.6